MHYQLRPLRQLVLFTFLLLTVSLTAHAQRKPDATSYYRAVPVPAHLMPIERAYGSSSLGSVYFYGGKKLSSPYSLEIPFFELDDPEVSHHFQVFRTLTKVGQLTAVFPLVYILFQNNRQSAGTYWTVVGGTAATSLTLTIIGNSHVRKSVTRYNEMLRQPRVGVSLSAVPLTGQVAMGMGVSWGFK